MSNIPEDLKDIIFEALTEGLRNKQVKIYAIKVYKRLCKMNYPLAGNWRHTVPIARRVIDKIGYTGGMAKLEGRILFFYNSRYDLYLKDCEKLDDPEAEALAKVAEDIVKVYEDDKTSDKW